MNKCLACGKPVKNKFCNVGCQNKIQIKHPSIENFKKGHIKRFGDFKIFKVNCFKCGKKFEISEREKLYPQKEKYYCSRSCANTRKHSDDTKQKIKNSTLKKEHSIKICKCCYNEFKTHRNNQIFCSQNCSTKFKGGWKTVHQKLNPEDWSKIQKLSYSKGNRVIAGGLTKWYPYKNIKVQGTYELRTCYILDKWIEEGKIKNWEYTNDRIKYISIDNKEHSYLLDFKIFESDNSFYYIETKGYKHPNDDLKWKAVREAGNRLEVWFEKDIIKKEDELGV
jgi:hypothetical protein